MKTASAKQKGRKACQEIKELLLKNAPELQPDDITVTPSGVTGEDIKMSPLARKRYPFNIEAKNQENISIWACLEQAQSHKVGDNVPLLFFKRNRTELHVALKAEDFIRLISKKTSDTIQ